MVSMRGFSLGGAVLLLALVFSGCAAPGGAKSSAAAEPRQAAAQPPSNGTVRPTAAQLPAAAAGLVRQAEEASAEGRHAEAASLLERAVRIAPEHPVVWHNLAVVRYRQADYRQAEQTALRSLELGRAFPSLQQRNWELIAVARELSGDRSGAGAARTEAARLREAAAGR
jgi:tetratricopeptide (TPR) repeat protein